MCRAGGWYFPSPIHLLLDMYLGHFCSALDFVADQHPREVERLLDVSQAHSQHVDAVANEPRVVCKGLHNTTLRLNYRETRVGGEFEPSPETMENEN